MKEAPDFLRQFAPLASHGLVIFDHQGCGQEGLSALELAAQLDQRLSATGWGDRACAIVIEPELENWVWSDSPGLPSVLGWRRSDEDLREWLVRNRLWEAGARKPAAPKEAMEAVLRHTGQPRSQAVYREIARTAAIEGCRDHAFLHLKTVLRSWFPA